MEFSAFCNICYSKENVKNISIEKEEYVTLILVPLFGQYVLLNKFDIYLCFSCCELLTQIMEFRNKGLVNLIELRRSYLDLKTKLEGEHDVDISKKLKHFVDIKVRRRSEYHDSDADLIEKQIEKNLKILDNISKDLNICIPGVDYYWGNDNIQPGKSSNDLQLVAESNMDIIPEQVSGFICDNTQTSEMKEGSISENYFSEKSNSYEEVDKIIEHEIDILQHQNDEAYKYDEIKDTSKGEDFTNAKNFPEDNNTYDVLQKLMKEEEELLNDDSFIGQDNSYGTAKKSVKEETGVLDTFIPTEGCSCDKGDKRLMSNVSIPENTDLPEGGEFGSHDIDKLFTQCRSVKEEDEKSVVSESSDISHTSCNERCHTDDRPVECSECKETFLHPGYLRTHARVHTAQKPYKCSMCNKEFPQSRALTVHKRSHSDDIAYHCSTCKASANETLHELEHSDKHGFMHMTEKPFKCRYCNKDFRSAAGRERHKRIHNDVKHYECSICKKAFKTENFMARHMLRHTGEKLYKCTVCMKTFVYRADLTRHARSHRKKNVTEETTE